MIKIVRPRARIGTSRRAGIRDLLDWNLYSPLYSRSDYSGVRLLFRGCPLPEDMRHVLVILDTEVLHDFGVLKQWRLPVHRERPGISTGIVNGDLVVQMRRIGTTVALDDMQLLGMRVADSIKPKLVVESDRVYDQRVSLPCTSRIAVPGGVQVLGMAAAVHEDLPVGMHVSLDQEDDQLGSLDNLPRKRGHARDARGHATRIRVVFRQPLPGELDSAGL